MNDARLNHEITMILLGAHSMPPEDDAEAWRAYYEEVRAQALRNIAGRHKSMEDLKRDRAV